MHCPVHVFRPCFAEYARGYAAMGTAIRAAAPSMLYSCSWPAYLGDDEDTKPYAEIRAAGCNLWRSWTDVTCEWSRVLFILDHVGNYSATLANVSGPGLGWTDPDQLVVGNGCITGAEEETQMALFALMAAPLIMGNDVRRIASDRGRATLLNRHAIAVDQDPLGRPGHRLSPYARSGIELWARGPLHDGAFAVALVNKGDAAADATLLPSAVLAGLGQAPPAGALSLGIFDIFAETAVGQVAINGSWCFLLLEPHGVKFLRLAPLAGGGGARTHHGCTAHPPAPPGPGPGPFPPLSPPCPAPQPPGAGKWVGPFSRVYSDQDCPNLGNHLGTLTECKSLCTTVEGCTAMNWGPDADADAGGGCALRGCTPANAFPTGPALGAIQGYYRCNTARGCPSPGPGPAPRPPAPPAPPSPPRVKLMTKIGAYVMQAAETSPVDWNGRTLLVQTVSGNTPGVYACCVCRTFGCVANASAPIGYSDCSGCTGCTDDFKRRYGSCAPQFIQLVDYATLEVLVSPIPGTEAFEMASATVHAGKLWVFGTNGVNTSRISCFSSGDPLNRSSTAWDAVVSLHLPPGLVAFNTDVHQVSGSDPLHPARQHIMVIETNSIFGTPAAGWAAFFAETNASTPDRGWQLLDPPLGHLVDSSRTMMTACPSVRFFGGWYYVATTTQGPACPAAGWVGTRSALCVVVLRSRTLRSGDWVLGNGGRPIVFPGPDDRRVAPQWAATGAERAAIFGHAPQQDGDINNSDFDFCDTADGVLGIFAGIANQASNPYFNIAALAPNTTSAAWLASYF